MKKINDYVFTIQHLKMENNSFVILNDNKECYVIDPSWNGDKIIEFIEENEYHYLGIIATHLHFDHVSDIKKICEHFNNYKIICSHNSKEEIISGEGYIFFGEDIKRDEYSFEYVTENDKLDGFKDLQFIMVPGHSECCMVINYKECLFVGDFILGESIGRTDLPFSDDKKMKSSLNKFIKYMSNKKDSFLILPGHGYIETWKFFKNNNHFLK